METAIVAERRGAAAALKQILPIQNANGWHLMATLLFNSGRVAEVLELLETKDFPDDGETCRLRALLKRKWRLLWLLRSISLRRPWR